MLQLRQIPTPAWAFEPIIDYDKTGGIESRQAFQPHLQQVLAVLHEHMEQFVNDPEFYRPDELREEEDPMAFPETARLTGEYYLGNQHYYSWEWHGQKRHVFSITFRFIQPPFPGWPHPSDYLSLEARVEIPTDTGDIDYLPGLDYAAI